MDVLKGTLLRHEMGLWLLWCAGRGERRCREAARLKLWCRSEACWFYRGRNSPFPGLNEVRYISGGVARLSSPPKAPKHLFREIGIGSVDVCCVLCLEMLLRVGVLWCDRAAAFDGGRVRHSTCVVL